MTRHMIRCVTGLWLRTIEVARDLIMNGDHDVDR